jgi:DNA repair protein SbcD/Mre11
MKLLHTADWHLNGRLGSQDRTGHLQARVEEVARLCESEKVDVVVIAGDLFSERAEVSARVNQVAESFRHLRTTFAAFFARGGIVLAVTGNHDQDGRVRPALELARAGMDITAPPLARGGYFQTGKLYLLDSMFVGRVRDARAGFDVQFVLVPFAGLSRIQTGSETASTAAELNRPVATNLADRIRDLPNFAGYDASLRTVLVAHAHVHGADVGKGAFRVSESSAVLVDATALQCGFDYVALGHIHKHQLIRGLAHIRYAGSLDRMDFGERDETKGVVLVDLGPDGRRGDPRFVEIAATPMADVTVSTADCTAEELKAQVGDPSALVRVTVEPAAADAGAALALTIREALPNVTNVEWRATAPAAAPAALAGASVRERVLEYLGARIDEDDPLRADLLKLVGDLLTREEHP